MGFSVWFHPEAEKELEEAVSFLDRESPGLGELFLDDVKNALKIIQSFPEAAPVLRGQVRRKILRRFPYSIFFSCAGSEIHVLAVAHQRRRPFYWRRR